MAELASYIIASPRTIQLTAASVTRGVRVVRNSSGLCAVTTAAIRGDYVTMTTGAASESIQACSMFEGAKVPAMFDGAIAVGDLVYAGANGKFSPTATSAVCVGRCTLAASGDNVLGEVELFSGLTTV